MIHPFDGHMRASNLDVTHVGAIVLGAALPENKLTVLDLTGNSSLAAHRTPVRLPVRPNF